MPSGITFNRATWKYEFEGQSFDTLEQAQAAQTRPSAASLYDPVTQTYATPTSNTVSVQTPSGQTIQGPSVVQTPGLIGGSGLTGSMGSLARAAGSGSSSGGGSTYNAEDERLRLAGLQNARDAVSEQERYDTEKAATADANARAAQDRMMAFISPYLTGGTAAGGTGGTAAPAGGDALAQSAQDAAFARAKDRTADLARSSLMTLRAAGAERGVNVAGGNNPSLTAAEGRVISDANKPLSDLTRDQAIQTSDRAAAVDDRNYAGNIALSGQKAQQIPSLLSLLKVGGLY